MKEILTNQAGQLGDVLRENSDDPSKLIRVGGEKTEGKMLVSLLVRMFSDRETL